MEVSKFLEVLKTEFYVGVPDSKLKALCNFIVDKYGVDGKHHIIAANEGNAVGIAAGYHLATSKIPLVYMQNSGEGNAINPIASLLNDEVYGIPCIFVVGWRGEPGLHDEPQHIYQGKITCDLLKIMNIEYMIIDSNTTVNDVEKVMESFNNLLSKGKQVAFVVKKDGLTFNKEIDYKNNNSMIREEIIKRIVKYTYDDLIVSTTGKTSRELFEVRELNNQNHSKDFLTVGSMGHSSSIALGIALQRPKKRVWILDGDGALLMHMGALSVIGSLKPANLIHIVINNNAHESVGGQPTSIASTNLCELAKSCGYLNVFKVTNLIELDKVLKNIKDLNQLTFIEIISAIGSRDNLGRPTIKARNNKDELMLFINQDNN